MCLEFIPVRNVIQQGRLQLYQDLREDKEDRMEGADESVGATEVFAVVTHTYKDNTERRHPEVSHHKSLF